jgi:hypothetical protein
MTGNRADAYGKGGVMLTRSIGFRLFIVPALVGVVFVATIGSTLAAKASAGPPTRGDAEAAFQAFFAGGSAIRAHNPLAGGAPGVPVDPPPDSTRIYPAIDDAVYCAQGWHVVMLASFDDPTLYPGGNQELFEFLSAVTFQFFLDGAPLEMERTSIKRFPHPEPGFFENPLMAVTFGAFLQPGALSEGSHELRTIYHDPLFDAEFTVSFTVVSC